MKQRAVAIVADYLSHRPRGRVVRDQLHEDRDVDGELFQNCVPCQAELVEIALAREVER